MPLVAEVTASLAAMWELARDTDLTTTVNYVGDKHFDNDQSNSFSMIPAYTTVDVKLRHQANHWMLSAHINNLFDEKYFEYGVRSSFTPGRYNAYPLPERNFLVSVSRTFD